MPAHHVSQAQQERASMSLRCSKLGQCATVWLILAPSVLLSPGTEVGDPWTAIQKFDLDAASASIRQPHC